MVVAAGLVAPWGCVSTGSGRSVLSKTEVTEPVPSNKTSTNSIPPKMRANWRKLRQGMTMDKVLELLGAPRSKHVYVEMEIWYYPSPGSSNPRSTVTFQREPETVLLFEFYEE